MHSRSNTIGVGSHLNQACLADTLESRLFSLGLRRHSLRETSLNDGIGGRITLSWPLQMHIDKGYLKVCLYGRGSQQMKVTPLLKVVRMRPIKNLELWLLPHKFPCLAVAELGGDLHLLRPPSVLRMLLRML